MTEFPWLPDHVAFLKAKWTTELWSAARIGVELGCSKNAVMGKVTRLGLTRRKPVVRWKLPKRNPARKLKVKKMPKTAIVDDDVLEPDFEPLPPVRSEVWQPLPGTTPVPLLNVTGCLWRVGDDPYLFCNSHKQDGLPYCPTHAAMAYQRAK